jgi:hypothetical protein
MLMAFQRGVLQEPGRLRIVAVLWEKALTHLLLEIDTIKTELNEKPTSRLDTVKSISGSGQHQEQSDEEMIAEVALFSARQMAIVFSSSLIQHYERLHSPKVHEYLAIALGLLKDAKMHRPRAFTPKQRRLNTKIIEYSEIVARYIVNFFAGKQRMSHAEMWKRREEYQRYMMAELGLESYPSTQKSWEDIPIEVLSLSAQFAHMVTASKKIRVAIERKDWMEAERLVDQMLVREINELSNDPVNKAELMEFRSEIDEGKG